MNREDRCELEQKIVLDKPTKFSFWYYMRGIHIGTFDLLAGNTLVWSMTGQQTPEWLQAIVYLPSGSYYV